MAPGCPGIPGTAVPIVHKSFFLPSLPIEGITWSWLGVCHDLSVPAVASHVIGYQWGTVVIVGEWPFQPTLLLMGCLCHSLPGESQVESGSPR